MKVMQPLIAPDGQVWIHEPCMAVREMLWPQGPAPYCDSCERPGEWLKVYVEKEEKRDGQ